MRNNQEVVYEIIESAWRQIGTHAAVERVTRLVEALESVTERQKGIPASTVFRHDVVIHGGLEHRDTEEGRAACKVCAALADWKGEGVQR